MIAFQTSLVPRHGRGPRPEPVEGPVPRMARTMRELAFAGQTVDENALANAGFTLAEIEEHKNAARDRANRDSIRRVS